VLEQHAALDIEAASPDSAGQTNDGLPPGVDEVARIPNGAKGTDPVRMARRVLPDATRWLFSQATVSRIEPWYDGLEDRWLRDRLPEALFRAGPRGLLRWQWLAFPLLALLGWLFGWLFGWLARRVLRPLLAPERRAALLRLGGPLTLFGAFLFVRAFLGSLALNPPAEEFALQLVKAGFLVALFWALLRLVDLGVHLVANSPWAKTHAAAVGALPTGGRVAKVVTVAMAAIAVLSELGYPVASLIAGLGIGGLAIALAAQKTVENLIGSVAIGIDQPFKVGDFVRIDGVVGTVELIGLRSTRVRTLERTIVSFPNGKLADMRAETFGPRDRILLTTNVVLAFDTRAEQIKAVIAGIEALLAQAPKISKVDAPLVRLSELLPSSMKIEVWAWFDTTDWSEFTRLRQETLLGILEVVERAGTRIALPAQVVHAAKA